MPKTGEMVVHVLIDEASLEAIERLGRLRLLMDELAEDFSYREDIQQARDELDWLLEHTRCQRTCMDHLEKRGDSATGT